MAWNFTMATISIHAPHARSDIILPSPAVAMPFQSTLLMRGATVASEEPYTADRFQSTLLMRGATARHVSAGRPSNFNPRSSCEERLIKAVDEHNNYSFQSTLLMRGATQLGQAHESVSAISIHAPHARSDNFLKHQKHQYLISIHAPHARSDVSAKSSERRA